MADSVSKHDNLQKLYLEAQKEAMRFKSQISKVDDKNTYLETEIGISNLLKAETAAQIEDARRDVEEKREEATKYFMEWKKAKAEAEGLKSKNVSFNYLQFRTSLLNN